MITSEDGCKISFLDIVLIYAINHIGNIDEEDDLRVNSSLHAHKYAKQVTSLPSAYGITYFKWMLTKKLWVS